MQLKVSPISRQECSAEEWQARVDLAAAHRIAVMHGFNEGIFNHLTLSVPGKPDRYYQIPFGLHWSEIKASTFMEVGVADGKVKRGAGDVERSCYLHPCPHPPGAAEDGRRRVPHPHAVRQRADAAGGPAHQGDRPDRGGADGRHRLRRHLHGSRLRHGRGRAPRQGPGRQGHPLHGQPRRHHGGGFRGRGLRSALLPRAGGAGADLRHVDRPAPQAAARAGGGEDRARYRRRAASTTARRRPSATSMRSSACSTARSRTTWSRRRLGQATATTRTRCAIAAGVGSALSLDPTYVHGCRVQIRQPECIAAMPPVRLR